MLITFPNHPTQVTITWEEQQKIDVLDKVYHRRRKRGDPLARRSKTSSTGSPHVESDLFPAHMQDHTTLRQLVPVPPSRVPGRPELILPSLPNFNIQRRQTVPQVGGGDPLEIEEREKPGSMTYTSTNSPGKLYKVMSSSAQAWKPTHRSGAYPACLFPISNISLTFFFL